MHKQLETALHELGQHIDLADSRTFKLGDWMGHHTDVPDPKRVQDHIAGIRDALKVARAWHNAVRANIPPFTPTTRPDMTEVEEFLTPEELHGVDQD